MEKSRNLNLLIFGQLFAIFSSKLLDLAAGMVFLDKVIDSGLNIGFFNAIFIIPCIFFIVPFSDISVFLSRKRMLLFGDIYLFALMLVFFFLQRNGSLTLTSALVHLIIHRIATTNYRLALDFTVVEWASDIKQVKLANICYSGSITVAPIVGASIYFLFGSSALFGVAAFLFLVSIIFGLFLKNGLPEKLFFRKFTPFKLEDIQHYIMYDSNKKLRQLIKLDFTLNLFFVPIFMCVIPITVNSIGLKVSTLGGTIAIVLIGLVLAVYNITSSKRKIVSLNAVVIVLFVSTSFVGIITGLGYYSFLNEIVFEVLFFFTMAIAGVCFTMANIYTYLEYRKLVNYKMEKDFFTYHLFGLAVACGIGNLFLGILLNFLRIGLAIIIMCLIATVFVESIQKVNVSKK